MAEFKEQFDEENPPIEIPEEVVDDIDADYDFDFEQSGENDDY